MWFALHRHGLLRAGSLTLATLSALVQSGAMWSPAPSPPHVVCSAKATAPVRRPDPADAVPRVERIAAGHPNRPYAMRGAAYKPKNSDVKWREIGVASWYGRPFHGKRTSTGEVYNMYAMTAAHPTMPLPSYARVRNLKNGRTIIVKVNDRGPFVAGRKIDLSYAAARKLRIHGLGQVEVVRFTNSDIRTGAWRNPSNAAKPTVTARSTAGARSVTIARNDGGLTR